LSVSNSFDKTVFEIEALILKLFQNEPFHNLYLLYNKTPLTNEHGGTCSDKTLSFISAARGLGVNAVLHNGYINGKDIHRLARVTISDKVFFADVGNGWPVLKLYPADQEINFICFGMSYRTVITEHWISVYHTRNGKEFLQLEIDSRPCREEDIQNRIAQRFNGKVIYPFSNSLRFSLIVKDKFLFIRGDRLEIYDFNGCTVIEGITKESLSKTLKELFYYQSKDLFEYLTS